MERNINMINIIEDHIVSHNDAAMIVAINKVPNLVY